MRFITPFHTTIKQIIAFVIVVFSLFMSQQSAAQIANATENKYEPLITTKFPNLTVNSSSGGFTSTENKAIDGNLGDPATWNYLASLGLVSRWIEVRDPSAEPYPAGTYAGFVIGNEGLLDAASSVTITTYAGNADNNTVIETYNPGNTLLSLQLLGGGTTKVGFVATKPFNRVRVTFSVVGLAGSRSVYYAEVVRARALSAPECNTLTALTQTNYPAVVKTGTSGIATVNLDNIFSNVGNVVDGSTTNPATIAPPASIGAKTYLGVALAGTGTIPAGYFAGFEIANSSLLNLKLLENSSISTYKRNYTTGLLELRDSIYGSSLLIDLPLLSSTGRFTVGFVANNDFDEIRYNLTNLAGVNLGSTRVYRAVVKRFCERATDFACNTLTPLNSTVDPVYINMANTGVSGAIAVGNNISGLDSIIDGNPNTAATLSTLANALSGTKVSVKKALSINYPMGTYVAFDIETKTLLSASVLSSATIRLLENGGIVQTSTGNGLLVGAKSSLLGNNTRQLVGIVATVPFDEIQIEFNKPVNADLGNIKIYGIDVQKSCDHALACNTVNNIINRPSGFGVVINNERSGVSGAVCAGCTIQDINHVTDADSTNFARMVTAVGALSATAISVHAPASTFNAGTIAGFTIRTNSTLIGLDLFKNLAVEIYNNGTLVARASGTQLLSLELLGLISLGSTNGAVYNVGLVAPAAYDEIRIVQSGVVQASVLSSIDIDVYRAFVDTRFSFPGIPGSLSCPVVYTLPDINYTTINRPVQGSVATNDKQPANASYSGGTEVPGADGQGNPAGATLTLHTNGTYEFTATQAGVYSYMTIMTDPLSGKTYKENLTITVTNPADATGNPPVVNTDVSAVKSNNGSPGYAGVNIPVLANDKPGNPGKTLGQPSIPVGGQPRNGTATVKEDGTINYIPDPGFLGTDTLTYRVCETGGSNCGFAYVVIKVTPNESTVTTPGGPVTTPASGNIVGADDYTQTKAGRSVADNVLTNDVDPLGHALSASTTVTVPASTGSFALSSNGGFTFTPAVGFSGTLGIPYKITDQTDGGRTAMATLYIYVASSGLHTNPDNNVGYKGLNIPGDVHTNDKVPAGTTYGTPVAAGTLPGTPTLFTWNNNGTYIFKSDIPGIYKYNVPVCLPAPDADICTSELLTITILDPAANTNDPVAMNDVVTVNSGSSGNAIKVKENDKPGNAGGTLASPVVITTQAQHGTATAQPDGTVTYTPNAGYTGPDSFIYEVEENPSGKKGSAKVAITVKTAATLTASAADDYFTAAPAVEVAGDVSTNDGSGQNVTPIPSTTDSRGTYSLDASGNFKFTPAANFTGTAVFEYTTCISGGDCAKATVYVTVGAAAVVDLSINMTVSPTQITGSRTLSGLISVFTRNDSPTNGTDVKVYIPLSPNYTITYNPALVTAQGTPLNNGDWTFEGNDGFYYVFKLGGTNNKTTIGGNTASYFGVSILFTAASSGVDNIGAFLLTGSGGDATTDNNTDGETIIYNAEN